MWTYQQWKWWVIEGQKLEQRNIRMLWWKLDFFFRKEQKLVRKSRINSVIYEILKFMFWASQWYQILFPKSTLRVCPWILIPNAQKLTNLTSVDPMMTSPSETFMVAILDQDKSIFVSIQKKSLAMGASLTMVDAFKVRSRP